MNSVLNTALILILQLLFGESSSQSCAAAYGQCGGQDWTGPKTCCDVNYVCIFSNSYYSQCRPSSAVDPNCPNNQIWGQCGGQGYSGPKCCPLGSACVYQQQYYSQCLPSSATSGTTTTTSVKTTTKSGITTTRANSMSTTKPTSTTRPTTTTKQTTKAGSTTTKATTTARTTTKLSTATTKASTTTRPTTTTSKASTATATTRPATATTRQTTTTSSNLPIFTGVLGTNHNAYEVGSCELPAASYDISTPVALGDIAALQQYRWRPELCGHILRVNCNNTGSVDIIVTNSNLGGGLDMYTSSWKLATNSAPPGITYCRVQLTTRNILTTSGYKCFYNDGWQDYYRNVALLNTNGRIVAGATLSDGRVGAHRGGNPYWAFDGYSPLTMTVTFRFEDGGTHSVKLSECTTAGSKQMWK